MLSFPKSDRCRVCRDERSLRSCPRRRKDIGWRCCNEMRVDLRCPAACSYAARKDETAQSPFPAFKADSASEFTHAIKMFIDLWIHHPNPALDDSAPVTVAQSDSTRLLDWLSGFRYPSVFPMNYLLEKLRLPKQEEPATDDPELIAARYLDSASTLDWQELRPLTINQADEPELAARYLEIISSIPTLKKVKQHSLIHAGLADDGITALVFVEINRKQDWTMIFSNQNGKWQLRQQLAGSPALFYSQNALHTSIAEALGAGNDTAAWELLERNMFLYPDSADLRYYLALYWQLVKEPDKAKVEYFNAVALDNDFYAPAFSLGSLNLSENRVQEAQFWFSYLAERHPDDLNVQNNLAACHAGKGEIETAKAIWRRIMAINPDYELAAKNLERYQ